MGFPTVHGRSVQVSASSDASAWTFAIPPEWGANLTGDKLYALVSADGSPTLSAGSGGWSKLAQVSVGLSATAAIFLYAVGTDSEVIPDLAIASSGAEQFSGVGLWVRSSTGQLAEFTPASSVGSSANSDPPSLTNSSGGPLDTLVVVTRHGDSIVVPSAAPSGYANRQSQEAPGNAGVSTDTAERQVALASGGSEDPGPWTVATEQWVCCTLGIYELDPDAGAANGGSIKVWDGAVWAEKPVKLWDGSAWVAKQAKIWSGSEWVAS